MAKRIVLLIRSDPRLSHRPCEAIRIALGLASSGHQVEVILTDKAPLLLMEEAEETVDGEYLVAFLETLKKFIPTFSIDQHCLGKFDLSESDFQTSVLTKEMLALKVATSECFFCF